MMATRPGTAYDRDARPIKLTTASATSGFIAKQTTSAEAILEKATKAAAEIESLKNRLAEQVATGDKKNISLFPTNIVFVRHGQSEANALSDVYTAVPNHMIRLTPRGLQEAVNMGETLKKEGLITTDDNTAFIYSPYNRTIQTMFGLLYGAGVTDRTQYEEIYKNIQEELRIRERDSGNFQDRDILVDNNVRKAYGWFYYRIPEGESGPDVCDRVALFLKSLKEDILNGKYTGKNNLVIVSHGATIRYILKEMFKLTVEQYSCLEEPENGSPIVLQKTTTVTPSTNWEEIYDFKYTENGKRSPFTDLMYNIEPKLTKFKTFDDYKVNLKIENNNYIVNFYNDLSYFIKCRNLNSSIIYTNLEKLKTLQSVVVQQNTIKGLIKERYNVNDDDLTDFIIKESADIELRSDLPEDYSLFANSGTRTQNKIRPICKEGRTFSGVKTTDYNLQYCKNPTEINFNTFISDRMIQDKTEEIEKAKVVLGKAKNQADVKAADTLVKRLSTERVVLAKTLELEEAKKAVKKASERVTVLKAKKEQKVGTEEEEKIMTIVKKAEGELKKAEEALAKAEEALAKAKAEEALAKAEAGAGVGGKKGGAIYGDPKFAKEFANNMQVIPETYILVQNASPDSFENLFLPKIGDLLPKASVAQTPVAPVPTGTGGKKTRKSSAKTRPASAPATKNKRPVTPAKQRKPKRS